jgi:hypothetical protein
MVCSLSNSINVWPTLLGASIFVIIVDRLFKGKLAQWYKTHLVINAINSYYVLPDLIGTFKDPLHYVSTTSSIIPSCLTLALHYYHAIAYKNLAAVDWAHHILMMLILTFPVFCSTTVSFTNYSIFFLCGVPGGIDYLLLILVKHKHISKHSEKMYNSIINTWLRMPGIVFGAVTLLYRYIYGVYGEFGIILITVSTIIYAWNGIYFQERVVYNYGFVSGQQSCCPEKYDLENLNLTMKESHKTQTQVETQIVESSEMQVETQIVESSEMQVETQIVESSEIQVETQIVESSEMQVETQIVESPEMQKEYQSQLEESPEMQVETQIVESPEMQVETQITESPEIQVETQITESPEIQVEIQVEFQVESPEIQVEFPVESSEIQLEEYPVETQVENLDNNLESQ